MSDVSVIYVKCPTCKRSLAWVENEYDPQTGHAFCMDCLRSWTMKKPGDER